MKTKTTNAAQQMLLELFPFKLVFPPQKWWGFPSHLLGLSESKVAPYQKILLGDCDAQSTHHGARAGSGMRPEVPVAPLFAPQPRAREKKSKKTRPPKNSMPPPPQRGMYYILRSTSYINSSSRLVMAERLTTVDQYRTTND